MTGRRVLQVALLVGLGGWTEPGHSWASDPKGKPGSETVDALFAEWAKPESPGCAVAVVRSGKVVYAKGFGMADLEHDIPITPQTVFYIGSVSKQFAAFSVVLLAQDGKLALDDDVLKYLPELHDFGRPITIRHLIHHTSGLRDYFELFSLAGRGESDLITQHDLLEIIQKQRALNFPPGDRHLYSNSNYALLAALVERVTRESFHDWTARTIFEPLGMSRTQVGDDHQRIIKGRAWSYQADPKGRVKFKTVVRPYSGYGAGGIYSTVEDLARWMSNYTRPKVGDARAVRQMFERGRLNNGRQIDYAFALVIDEHRGLKRIGHAGSLAGYRAAFTFFPDRDLGVIILSNLASFPPRKAMEVADLYLAESIPPARGPEQPPALTADELRAYTGSYHSPELETTYSIAIERGTLVAKHHRKRDVALKPSGKDRFMGGGSFLQVRFERDPQGRVTGLSVSNDRVIDLRFQKEP